ncbi:hypothetical protein ACFWAP_09905 [Streptomyces goshikiensis]|uniref:hypothetical protein n=1 Tax=Streptomyces goshikiensis TaxID=1942 RepID=UPI00365543CC
MITPLTSHGPTPGRVGPGGWSREGGGQGARWTTSPATTTVCATVPGMDSTGTAKMSRDRTTQSAAFPTVSEPRSSSRKLA